MDKQHCGKRVQPDRFVPANLAMCALVAVLPLQMSPSSQAEQVGAGSLNRGHRSAGQKHGAGQSTEQSAGQAAGRMVRRRPGCMVGRRAAEGREQREGAGQDAKGSS